MSRMLKERDDLWKQKLGQERKIAAIWKNFSTDMNKVSILTGKPNVNNDDEISRLMKENDTELVTRNRGPSPSKLFLKTANEVNGQGLENAALYGMKKRMKVRHQSPETRYMDNYVKMMGRGLQQRKK